jgi:S-adenosylmethionine:tRNA ribosyltransferase-isomerase
MVVDKDKGTIEHKMFKDVLDEFDEGDVFVANDTRVFPGKTVW